MSSENASSQGADTHADPVIECVGLGKAYTLYDRPHHRLLELLGLRSPDRARKRWALRGVDLCVRRGECVGIIGQNGAGKSTLLQMIAGTVRATEGRASVNGRVAALLELTSGFNPELTGRENIGLRAAVLGLTNTQIRERMQGIIDFAGLAEQIDDPIRTYSTGMQARLAFAVAAHVDADVLIVDETLAVGDGMFVQKCMRWIRAFRARGTLLFVSHSTQLVTDLCDRAVWLDNGVVLQDAPAKDVVRAYTAARHRAGTGDAAVKIRTNTTARQGQSPSGTPAVPVDARQEQIASAGLVAAMEGMRFEPDAAWWGRGGAHVDSVRLLDAHGAPMRSIETGKEVIIEMRCRANEPLVHPVLGYVVRDRTGRVLFSDNSWLVFGAAGPDPIEAGRAFMVRFRVHFPYLPAGEYAVGAAIADGRPGDFVQHHRMDDAVIFAVPNSHLAEGLIGVPMLGCAIEPIEPSTEPAPDSALGADVSGAAR